MDIGPPELLIILVIILLLFGGAKLPKLARSLGEASKELKKGMQGSESDAKPVDAASTVESKTEA